jgi:dihydrolipoamide dehydrogenase
VTAVGTVNDFDLVVVGGGPGGYSTAIRAAQLGFSTALVEEEALGGVCLNWGCIPTKALLHAAELVHDIRHAADFGIQASLEGIDLAAMVGHSRRTAERLSKGVAFLLRKNGITHLAGRGRVAGKGQLSVTAADGSEQTFRVPHIILATGASLRRLPGLPTDDERIWDARAAMTATECPQHLVVIGAGAIGIEFASFYHDIGARVTLVEMTDRVAPTEDHEISGRLHKALVARGIDCRLSTRFAGLDEDGAGLAVSLEGPGGETERVACDRLLVAVGVSGNTRDLGLEAVGAELDGDFLRTDSRGRTNVAGLYAIGDVAGAPWLAHKAAHEGVACVEHIAGLRSGPGHAPAIPGCIYARPQVASIGLSEQAATAQGLDVRIGRFDLAANGKALAAGHGEGLVKTVIDAGTGELLGAHMIGHGVSEQIQGFAVAMGGELTSAEFTDTVFPHPTQSEAMHEAVLDADDAAINQ